MITGIRQGWHKEKQHAAKHGMKLELLTTNSLYHEGTFLKRSLKLYIQPAYN